MLLLLLLAWPRRSLLFGSILYLRHFFCELSQELGYDYGFCLTSLVEEYREREREKVRVDILSFREHCREQLSSILGLSHPIFYPRNHQKETTTGGFPF